MRVIPSPEFTAFCRGLYQDIGVRHDSLDDLAQACLSSLSEDQKKNLRGFLTHVLDPCTGADLKGLLRRGGVRDLFLSTEASKELLRAALRLPQATR